MHLLELCLYAKLQVFQLANLRGVWLFIGGHNLSYGYHGNHFGLFLFNLNANKVLVYLEAFDLVNPTCRHGS